MIKPVLVFYAVNEKRRMMICDLKTDEEVRDLLLMLVKSDELCFLFTEQAKKYGDYSNADYVLNEMYGAKLLYDSRTKTKKIAYASYDEVWGNRQSKEKCQMNETEKTTFKYNKGDSLLFVNRDLWAIDSVTVFERAETKMFPAYYVKLESGHITELPEKWLFASKKEAVEKIIECLKHRIEEERNVIHYFQGKLNDFQSWNFQMRYMGEVIE